MQVVYGARRSRVHPTAGLVGLSGPAPIASYPSVLPTIAATSSPAVDFRKPLTLTVWSQGQKEKCVGAGIRDANSIAVGGQGQAVSEDGVWTDARALERTSVGAAISNTGCDTNDAYNASVSTGWYPRDARDDDPNNTSSLDTVDELVARVPVPLACFAPLADGDVDSMQRWATAGCCTTFTMWVGPAYQALSSTSPIWTGEPTSSGGYHRQVFIGYGLQPLNGAQVLCAIVWNSWGAGWADGGFSYIPLDVFAKVAIEPVTHRGGICL